MSQRSWLPHNNSWSRPVEDKVPVNGSGSMPAAQLGRYGGARWSLL